MKTKNILQKLYTLFFISLIGLQFSINNVAFAGNVGTMGSQTTATALSQLSAATNISQASVAMQLFLDQYSLVFSANCPTLAITNVCTSLTDADLLNMKNMGKIFIEEWSKYPIAWTALTDNKKISFVTNYGIITDALNNIIQYRAAAPLTNVDAMTMLYDVNYATNSEYMRQVTHHEYAHYVMHGLISDMGVTNDSTWEGFNPPGFTYGTGGSLCYSGSCPTGEHVVTGFITGYATSAWEEDWSETYAYLFVNPMYDRMLGYVATDTALANKVSYLKQWLASKMPTMDNSYWAVLHAVAVTPNVTTATTTGTNPTFQSTTTKVPEVQKTTLAETGVHIEFIYMAATFLILFAGLAFLSHRRVYKIAR